MAIYELRTFADIYNAVIEELKVQSTDTTTVNRIKRDINMIYLDEVVPYTSWYWLRKNIDITHNSYYSTGTASVTASSQTVTLSTSLSGNYAGKYFKVDAYDEIYTIRSHSGTDIVLETNFTGTTNATANFKIFDNGIVLPVDIIETYKVWNDHRSESMTPLGDKDFLNLVLNNPLLESRPEYYRVTDWKDPNPFDSISGLPAVSTVASSGLVKTIVFATTVASYFTEGDFIKVSSADSEAYNGEFIVEDVSTTTLTYISNKELEDSANADTNITFELKDSEDANEIYRKIEIYPYLNDDDTTIHVEGIRRIPALENDSDEPSIPLHDRISLMYGALHKGWSRLRNTEEAVRNFQLFERKLARMAAKIQDSTDHVKLKMNKLYLYGRRGTRRRVAWNRE